MSTDRRQFLAAAALSATAGLAAAQEDVSRLGRTPHTRFGRTRATGFASTS